MAAQHVGLEGGWKALAGSPNSVRTGPAGRSGRKVTVRPRSAPERRVAVVLMDGHGGGWGRVRGPTLFQGPRQSPPEVARATGGLPYLFWHSRLSLLLLCHSGSREGRTQSFPRTFPKYQGQLAFPAGEPVWQEV